jgi:DNA-binding CsgD family transcriptional regulator
MGAFHFLEKPFHEHDLWSAIQEAIQFDRENRKAAALQDTIDARISMLSEKEIAVLELLATCKNKHVMAEELGVSIRTIEHYRTQLMRKLKINSVVGLLHIALTAKRSSPHFLRDAVLLGHDGNGAGDVPKQFIGHNGYHALQQPQNPVRRRNSK